MRFFFYAYYPGLVFPLLESLLTPYFVLVLVWCPSVLPSSSDTLSCLDPPQLTHSIVFCVLSRPMFSSISSISGWFFFNSSLLNSSVFKEFPLTFIDLGEGHAHATVHLWKKSEAQESIVPSVMWAPGIPLRKSDLAPSTATHWAISLAPELGFLTLHCFSYFSQLFPFHQGFIFFLVFLNILEIVIWILWDFT